MTATSPVCSPASSHSSQSSPVCLPACCRHLRIDKAFQTKLHLRSAPGVWLLLGAIVVLVGMAVVVVGYVSAVHKPIKDTHIKRMKLVGPVVMGLGLFIFICAATLLYENRDQEVHRRETPDDLKDLKGGDGSEDSQEQPSFSCQEQWECKDGEQGTWAAPTHVLPLSNQNCCPTLPPSHRNTHNIISRSSQSLPSDAGGRDREEEEEEEKEGRATLLAQVQHHQEPTPPPPSPCPSISHSSVYSDSCNSSETNFNVRTGFPQH
ncbi:uncharacterized protein LOC129109752 [Anoplopoma fimbria]|uniref:uncharacterized protein LOC129109752 n=1 Tax=Anoplopoma fimbria TaxID=229290 RepID=UPI0023EC2FA8|nr:uncharacterized protein LOC129109752 [Anoplopoma fimbria]